MEEIDPRLQDSIPGSHPYQSTSISTGTSGQYTLPPSPPSLQQQQQHQQQFGAPPPWPQNGYGSYYGPSDQNPSPVAQMPQQTSHMYQSFQDPTRTPMQVSMQPELSESKRTRACEACRGLKVKCDPDPDGGPCKRCAKANRHCVISAPSRKRQKKTDSRVEELERKIDALTQSLKSTKEGNVSGSDDGIGGEEDGVRTDGAGSRPYQQLLASSNSHESGRKRNFTEFEQRGSFGSAPANVAPMAEYPFATKKAPYMTPEARMAPFREAPAQRAEKPSDLASGRDADVVARGILPTSVADELFGYYTKSMSPHMPIVAFPHGTSSETVRKISPILFLAILSVASIQHDSDLRVRLNREIMQILGDRIFASPEKSLELVQALQVVTVWYWPEVMSDSKYLQFVHFATAMAIALGINEEAEAQKPQVVDLQPTFFVPNTGSTECRRAWLGCYLLSSNISMGRRRLNPVHVDGYLLECLSNLRSADDALESDNVLCDLVQLQTFADDLAAQILPRSGTIIPETRVRNAHKGFERQMQDWQESKAQDLGSVSLTQSFNVVNLYMHELAMQHVARSEPSKQSSRPRGKNQSHASPFAQSSSSSALNSTLGILDTFSKFNPEVTRSLPVFFFAQLAHAGISLIKIYYVGKADEDFNKHNPVTSDLVEQQLSRLIESLQSTTREGSPLAANSFLKMMMLLKTLFMEHKNSDIDSVKARYGAVPSFKKMQMLDLEEPQPTPQYRSAAQQAGKTADGALQILSEVAMGKSEEGLMGGLTEAQSRSEDGGVAAMGKLIGEGNMGSVSDEGIFGIMQTMWVKRVA